MKTFTIGWLNKCRCGNKSHTVKTARGNESALWDDDAVKCNSCGRGGVIQVCEGQARVLWETDEEMEEGKPMSTITKERAQQIFLGNGPEPTASEERELARIALASLEAEPVAWLLSGGGAKNNVSFDSGNAYADPLREVTPLYTAPPAPANAEPVAWLWSHRKHPSEVSLIRPEDDERAEGAHWSGWSCQALYAAPPAPVSVPDGYRLQPISEYDAMCAAMLQGANGTLTNEGTIPVTQFKPVADLYGLTSPTGGETSFTFDAVEARDFVDGGWSCQEYVELGRYQEALTDHSEDKLAMVDHSGDSNNMVEPVTTACKLRDAVEIIRNSGIEIDAEKIFAERDALNAPDCWCRTCRPVTISDMRFVVCPECGNKRCPHANDHRNACTGSNEPGQEGSAYPAAPQQEVTS